MIDDILETNYIDIPKNEEYENIAKIVLEKCFEEEGLQNKNLYVNVIFTTPDEIRKINNQYRNIDKITDVLSFPMFEKDEIEKIKNGGIKDILGDIVICIQKVKEQAIEYNHSFKRELAYMVVHSFYHLMGYDHIEQSDKEKMRIKEEKILEYLSIIK